VRGTATSPVLDDVDELDAVRCAAAKAGTAKANATANETTLRGDVAIVISITGTSNSTATRTGRKWLIFQYLAVLVSSALALFGGRNKNGEMAVASGKGHGATHATTVLAVRHQGKVVMASDGQVTLGQTVLKHQAKKVRRLYHDKVLAGFAGSAADGFSLFSRFEAKLEEHRGNLERAAVELARDWRTDRVLRRLEAMLLVADARAMYLLSGTGDLIEPDDGVIGIGSGGSYAMAAARALTKHSTLDARAIVEQAMAIAADICVYTNTHLTLEEIE
jgi:ATP-dependent HslUV protease subunit HslV